MAYYLNLFSPRTHEAFSLSDRSVSGFRTRQRPAAKRITAGDRLICYITQVSRWTGILEVVDGPFEDDTPIFLKKDDPFVVRFHVRPLVWLPVTKAVPIKEECVWERLSFTRGRAKTNSQWTGKVRSSLALIDEADGRFLEDLLRSQERGETTYEIAEAEYNRLVKPERRRRGHRVKIAIPSDARPTSPTDLSLDIEVRESYKIQALLASIGAQMGMQIWIPRGDRGAVLKEWGNGSTSVCESLPLNYDEKTIRTIEQIDVLWLRGRSIVRAFEVEHSTAVYSGILRMADLLALQPNMDIKLHIVAPSGRREKVLQELQRPVFSLLQRGPLSEICTYIPYDKVRELADLEHLRFLSDGVLDAFGEHA